MQAACRRAGRGCGASFKSPAGREAVMHAASAADHSMMHRLQLLKVMISWQEHVQNVQLSIP